MKKPRAAYSSHTDLYRLVSQQPTDRKHQHPMTDWPQAIRHFLSQRNRQTAG